MVNPIKDLNCVVSTDKLRLEEQKSGKGKGKQGEGEQQQFRFLGNGPDRTIGRTDKRTENLPILQDSVPYRGRCPASPMKTKEKVEQGKGTADHLMPLGYLFLYTIYLIKNASDRIIIDWWWS